jgi:adenylate kinase family enzyme
MPRIYVLGAAGSGTTTLGMALAARLGVSHEDSDRYFWVPTDPPYTTPRPPAERVALLVPRLRDVPHWVHSGATIGWGEPFWPLYELIVFVTLDNAKRMRRLRARELARHGERVMPGGDMHAGSVEFLEWAASYETAGMETRSRVQQEDWLARCRCPVLRLDSAHPFEELVEAVVAALPGTSASAIPST